MTRPDYEYDFDPKAPNNTAATIAELAASGGHRVLDLGSGPGIVAAYLQNELGRWVTCVDRDPELLTKAAARGVAKTLAADLEEPAWVEQLGDEQYDVILLADVLEHLVDPAAVVRAIADSRLLADGGYLVVSFPNAGHEAVIGELLAGRFTYQETGLLDASHLRFFTLSSMRDLLERNGFGVTRVARTKRTAEQTSLGAAGTILAPEIRERLVQDVAEIQTFQFILRAEPTTVSGQLAQLRRELSSIRNQESAAEPIEDLSPLVDELRAELEQLRELEDQATRRAADSNAVRSEAEAALARQQDMTQLERERATRLSRELERLRTASTAAADEASAEATRLQRELDKVYRSRTWRAGRLLWNIFHLSRRLLPKKTSEPTPDPAVVETSAVEQLIPPASVDYVLSEDRQLRDKYEAAVSKHVFAGRDRARNIAIAVYTTDLDEGRGDIYTAVGLGRHLEQVGFEVVYLPRDRWYDLPADTGTYLAMLETVDISRLTGDVTKVAWVRNSTDAWIERPWLPLYDLVLGSSPASLERIELRYPGRTAYLPLAVDTELFTCVARPEDRTGVVSTVNQWGRERQLHAYLQEAVPRAPVALYGQHRGMSPQLEPLCRGPVSFFALPSLYNQAAIVLDDFNHTTAPYGNVNSRVFEAVACGAVVMTNVGRGLDAVGLGRVAVFGSGPELQDLVERDLGSSDASKVAEELREHVVAAHSYAVRARQFAKLIEQRDERVAQPVIAYFPDYRENPYLSMLWAKLTRAGGAAVADSLGLALTARIAAQRPTVMHLNWTAPILGPGRTDAARRERYHTFLSGLDQLRAAGVPTIWTIHNVLPHECADPALEAQLRQEIADRVDVIHVMCEATVDSCAPHYQLPRSRVRVIPHPSYIDFYPNLTDRSLARDELRIDHNAFVYLHFGQVRPYKGVDRLLDAFDRLAPQHPDARLLLVGAGGRFEGIEAIKQRARAHPQVLSNFNHIGDADVQLYLNAADVVVLPHRSALNSGALQLAYSFARPVVAPESGCVAGLVDSTTGITYSPDGTTTSLLNAMLAARRLGSEHEQAAYARAAQSHSLQISDVFASLVTELIDQRSTETIL